jgi:CRP-like cAMP-binding protein
MSPLTWQDLRPLPLFAALDDDALRELAAHVNWVRLSDGQTLLDCARDDVVQLVVQGGLDVFFFGGNGRELQLGQLAPGWLLRGAPVMRDLGLRLTLLAHGDTVVARITQVEMEALFLREPKVMLAVMQLLHEVTWMLITRVLSLGALGVADRLRVHLLGLALQAGVEDNQAALSPAPRQAQLAALLGCSREEVARDMARLKRLGWLRRESGGRLSGALVLTDVQALRASIGAGAGLA